MKITTGSPFDILRDEQRWVAWREERLKTKPNPRTTKRCYTPGTSRFASTTDPTTWGAYSDAVLMKGCDGPGYVLTNHPNITAIDLDHAFDPATGVLRDWAHAIVEAAGSYVEHSPNTGLHVWGVVDDDVPTIGRSIPMGDNGQHAELYVRGGNGRYLTVTNKPFREKRPLANISELARRLLAQTGSPTNGASPADADPDAGLAWVSKPTVDLILHGAAEGADRSVELFKVVAELREIGWPTERIVALLRAHPEGIAQRCFERGRDEVERHVRLCLKKIDDNLAARRCASSPSPSSSPSTPPPSQPQTGGTWAGEGAGATWDDPDLSLIDDRRGELPNFPTNVFTPECETWIQEAAHGAGVSADFVAVPLLVVAGSLVGTARRVLPVPSWIEPLAMWGGVIGFSGTGKTPGLNTLRRPLGQLDRERRGHLDALRRAHETKAQLAKAARKAWEADVATAAANGAQPPVMPADAVDPGVFVEPRLYISDVTVERLALLISAQPRGALLIVDELAGWLASFNRYTGTGGDREFYLSAWNGDGYVVERMGRPPIVLDHLLVGSLGGIQPDKLSAALSGADDGLHARFLYSWPQEPPYQTLNDVVGEAEPFIQNTLRRLITLPAGAPGRLEIRSLPLSAEALAEFENFRREHYDRKQVLDGRERETWAKAPTHVLRLAGVLALLDWAGTTQVIPEPTTVEAQFIIRAVTLWNEYFWLHARAALRLIGLDDRHIETRRILRWLKATRTAETSREDVRVQVLSKRFDADQVQELIDKLVQAGWLREITNFTGRPGRPPRRWEVNPCLTSS